MTVKITYADEQGNEQSFEKLLGFSGKIYSKTMTMTDDNVTRFETEPKKLLDIVILVETNPMLLGQAEIEVFTVVIDASVGFTKVDISTLYFKNAGAGDNGKITILAVEE